MILIEKRCRCHKNAINQYKIQAQHTYLSKVQLNINNHLLNQTKCKETKRKARNHKLKN